MKSALSGTIAAAGLARLKQSAYQSVRQVNCEFDQGVLTLRGDVRSFFHKQVAQQLVVGLAGVERIDNQIDVQSVRPR
jgi:osmotically-inducible protein OsmY